MEKTPASDELHYLKEIDRVERKYFSESIERHEDLLRAVQKASQKLIRAFMASYIPEMEKWTLEQRNAVNTLVLEMFHVLVFHDVELLRKRGSDAQNHSRKMIELAAFAHECLESEKSAKLWVEAVESITKRKNAKSAFQAYPLVKRYFQNLEPRTLFDQYDSCCYFVHPSIFSVAPRIRKVADAQYSLAFHEVETTAELEIESLRENHGTFYLLLDSLASRWDSDSTFLRQKWNEAVREFGETFLDAFDIKPEDSIVAEGDE